MKKPPVFGMTILKGILDTSALEMVEAEFAEGPLMPAKYPDGFAFILTPLGFVKDDEDPKEDAVFSPTPDTIVHVFSSSPIGEDEDVAEGIYTKENCEEVLGVSLFALTDLFWAKREAELIDLMENSIMAREYEEFQI